MQFRVLGPLEVAHEGRELTLASARRRSLLAVLLIPAMFYGFSLTYCLTTSLAHDGEALGTCGLPEREVRARCERAGFATVDVAPFDNPFNVLYQATG